MVGIAPSMNPIMKLNAILPPSSSIGFPFNSGMAINRTFISFQEVCSSYSENWLRLFFHLFRQFFQSIGIAWKAMFLSLSRQVLFLIPAMLLFSRFWGLDGVWYAAPFSDFVAAVTAWLFLWYHVKNMKSKNSD
jgi:hypothetical protein